MKILQVSHDFVPETVAGAEVIAHNLSKSLTDKGHEVYVFCRGWDLKVEPYHVRDEEFDGLHVRRIDFGTAGQPHRATRHDINIDNALEKYLDIVQPDIIHFHALHFLTTDLIAVAKKMGKPIIITLHDFLFRCPIGSRLYYDNTLCDRLPDLECLSCLWPYNPSRKRAVIPWQTLNPMMMMIYRSSLKDIIPKSTTPGWVLESLSNWGEEFREALLLADAIHSPSHFLAQSVIEFGVPEEKVFVIENGIQYDVNQVVPKKPSTHLRFGQIGHSPLKGAPVAIEAMKHLTYADAELRIYGGITGKFQQELETLAANAHVKFMGKFQQNQIAEVFSEIDVLVVPSIWYENCPTVIREAFAHATPVVTSNVGGMIEAVREGIDGFHFQVSDPVDLAATLQRFVDDKELANKLRANIKLPPTASNFSDEIETIYQNLLQKERESRNV